MSTLVYFIAKLVASAADNIAGGVQLDQALGPSSKIETIIATLPGDIGEMIVGLLTGLAGVVTAVGGLFAP